MSVRATRNRACILTTHWASPAISAIPTISAIPPISVHLLSVSAALLAIGVLIVGHAVEFEGVRIFSWPLEARAIVPHGTITILVRSTAAFALAIPVPMNRNDDSTFLGKLVGKAGNGGRD